MLLTLIAKGVFLLYRDFRPHDTRDAAVETKELTLDNVTKGKLVYATLRWPACDGGARPRTCRQPIFGDVATEIIIIVVVVVVVRILWHVAQAALVLSHCPEPDSQTARY
jgi:hypothetical protein